MKEPHKKRKPRKPRKPRKHVRRRHLNVGRRRRNPAIPTGMGIDGISLVGDAADKLLEIFLRRFVPGFLPGAGATPKSYNRGVAEQDEYGSYLNQQERARDNALVPPLPSQVPS